MNEHLREIFKKNYYPSGVINLYMYDSIRYCMVYQFKNNGYGLKPNGYSFHMM